MGMSSFEFCQKLREPFVVITLVAGRGHVPQDLGAKAVVTRAGLVFGTIGGGKVEAKAIRYALERFQKREPELLTWNLQTDVGMTCGGEMTLLFESHQSSTWKIAVFGAGHVAQALVPLLSTLDCEVECIDPRQDWVEKLPEHKNLKKHLGDPKDLVKKLSADTFFVSVTQGHSHDVPVLEEIHKNFPDAPYIGVIGSAVKASAIRKELKERGVSELFIEKIRCPIGLELGTNHTGEIAVSIAAQLLQCRDKLKSRNSRSE